MKCALADGSDPADLIERAKAFTNISNSVRVGIPVTIEAVTLSVRQGAARSA